jgi:hypothetical protein
MRHNESVKQAFKYLREPQKFVRRRTLLTALMFSELDVQRKFRFEATVTTSVQSFVFS